MHCFCQGCQYHMTDIATSSISDILKAYLEILLQGLDTAVDHYIIVIDCVALCSAFICCPFRN